MSKYTEALRKIEEERVKKSSFQFQNYTVIVGTIAVIVLMAISTYGLYFRPQSKPVPVESSAASPVDQISKADPNELLLENIEKMMQISTVKTMFDRPVPEEKPAAEDFYTVQLIAYEQEDAAKTEAQKLFKQGFDVLILHGSKFFKVCVGKFSTEEQADGELQKVRAASGHLYRDAFIRLIQAENPAVPTKGG